MKMLLGDAFTRRKHLASEISDWINRLKSSGNTQRSFRTTNIEGDKAFVPEVGSEKTSQRNYSVEECQLKLRALITEDRDLALRISRTNQAAMAEVEDIDGNMGRYSVPELLVLKDTIIPKLEEAARATPLRADNVNIMEVGDNFVRHRSVKKVERKKETLSDKGLKTEEMILVGYDIVETTDYGAPSRAVWDEVDRVHAFLQRVKRAINQANKTELLD